MAVAWPRLRTKRVDVNSIFMHCKALNFSGMAIEGVLAAAIEPPTSFGCVLPEFPNDVQMGRFVPYGSFFN